MLRGPQSIQGNFNLDIGDMLWQAPFEDTYIGCPEDRSTCTERPRDLY